MDHTFPPISLALDALKNQGTLQRTSDVIVNHVKENSAVFAAALEKVRTSIELDADAVVPTSGLLLDAFVADKIEELYNKDVFRAELQAALESNLTDDGIKKEVERVSRGVVKEHFSSEKDREMMLYKDLDDHIHELVAQHQNHQNKEEEENPQPTTTTAVKRPRDPTIGEGQTTSRIRRTKQDQQQQQQQASIPMPTTAQPSLQGLGRVSKVSSAQKLPGTNVTVQDLYRRKLRNIFATDELVSSDDASATHFSAVRDNL
eukprot:PhM_4_TR3795/c0_g1_i1/m.48343